MSITTPQVAIATAEVINREILESTEKVEMWDSDQRDKVKEEGERFYYRFTELPVVQLFSTR